VSPYLNGHFELFAHLDHPTGVFRSNGLPGVNNDDICCEAQCGKCGGPGCGGRPGGSVRWCLCRFRLLPWPLISLALSEACSFVCPGPRKRGKIAGTQSLTSRLASVWPENGHRSAPQRRQVRRAVVEPFTTACYGRHTPCTRRRGMSPNPVGFLFVRIGYIYLFHSLVVITCYIVGKCTNARTSFVYVYNTSQPQCT